MSNALAADINFVLECMERKNLCLKSFHKLCGEFLDKIAKNQVETIEDFQRKRQSLIKVLESLEAEIIAKIGSSASLASIMTTSSVETQAKIAVLLNEKDSLIKAILDLDALTLGHINRVKGDTLQKIQSVQMGKKTITAYKSPLGRVESSEKQNKILDKKA